MTVNNIRFLQSTNHRHYYNDAGKICILIHQQVHGISIPLTLTNGVSTFALCWKAQWHALAHTIRVHSTTIICKERKKKRKKRKKKIRDAIRREFLQLMNNLSTTQILIPIGESSTHKWTMLQRTYGSQFQHWLHYHHTNLTFNNEHGCTRLWIPYHIHTHISGTLQTSQIPPLRKFSSSSQTFLAKHPYPNMWVSGSVSE